MRDQIKPQTQAQEFLDVYPELKNKQEIHVLLSLGNVHTSLYHSLRKEGGQTTRTFSKLPYIFGLHVEVLRSHMFNKPVDDQTVARVVAESSLHITLYKYFSTITKDSSKINQFIRMLVSGLSIDEIKNTFNRARSHSEFQDGLLKHISAKNPGAVPKTEKDMDKILAKPIPTQNKAV